MVGPIVSIVTASSEMPNCSDNISFTRSFPASSNALSVLISKPFSMRSASALPPRKFSTASSTVPAGRFSPRTLISDPPLKSLLMGKAPNAIAAIAMAPRNIIKANGIAIS